MLNLFIVRHGETLLNRLGKNQGWIDSDLTQEGINELEKIYRDCNLGVVDAVICSDLGRAKQTAEIILKYCQVDKKDVFYTKLLRERFLGTFEGDNLQKTRKKIVNFEGFDNYEEFLSNRSLSDFIDATKKYDINGLAENYEEFSARIKDALNMIKDRVSANDWRNVLIVSHANTILCMLDTLLDHENFSVEKIQMRNGQMFHLQNDDNCWKFAELS